MGLQVRRQNIEVTKGLPVNADTISATVIPLSAVPPGEPFVWGTTWQLLQEGQIGPQFAVAIKVAGNPGGYMTSDGIVTDTSPSTLVRRITGQLEVRYPMR